MAGSQDTNVVTWALSGTYDPEKPVLIDAVDPKRSISKKQALRLIASLAGAFIEDSTVCLYLPNDVLYPILVMAIYASKCRWTGANPSYKAGELEHHFKTSETKYIVTTEQSLNVVQDAVAQLHVKPEIILYSDILFPSTRPQGIRYERRDSGMDRADGGFRDLHDLMRERSQDSFWDFVGEIDADSIATLMPTSGTTGKPKMAARTHRATVFESLAIEDSNHNKPYDVRRLYCTPIFHAFSTPELVVNSLRLGFPAYFMKRYDDEVFPRKIQQFQITETMAPPALLLRLAQRKISSTGEKLHPLLQSLKTVFTGGAPVTPELRTTFQKIFPDNPVRITPVWGMTEGGWFSTFKYPFDENSISVGNMLPGYEVKLSAAHLSKDKDTGKVTSELYVRSPSMMSEYYGNPAATANAFEDGWLKTGDIGYIEDEKVFLIDRAKDMIKYNGFQVSPTEVEDALQKMPEIVDAAVIGAGEATEEHPLAFVVLNKDASGVSEKSVKAHLGALLSGYKVKGCEVRFIDEIPKSASGKILRTELRKFSQVITTRGSLSMEVLDVAVMTARGSLSMEVFDVAFRMAAGGVLAYALYRCLK